MASLAALFVSEPGKAKTIQIDLLDDSRCDSKPGDKLNLVMEKGLVGGKESILVTNSDGSKLGKLDADIVKLIKDSLDVVTAYCVSCKRNKITLMLKSTYAIFPENREDQVLPYLTTQVTEEEALDLTPDES